MLTEGFCPLGDFRISDRKEWSNKGKPKPVRGHLWKRNEFFLIDASLKSILVASYKILNPR